MQNKTPKKNQDKILITTVCFFTKERSQVVFKNHWRLYICLASTVMFLRNKIQTAHICEGSSAKQLEVWMCFVSSLQGAMLPVCCIHEGVLRQTACASEGCKIKHCERPSALGEVQRHTAPGGLHPNATPSTEQYCQGCNTPPKQPTSLAVFEGQILFRRKGTPYPN